jgi:hypothetical protein
VDARRRRKDEGALSKYRLVRIPVALERRLHSAGSLGNSKNCKRTDLPALPL